MGGQNRSGCSSKINLIPIWSLTNEQIIAAEDGYKLPEGQERRFLEEEGLYVGEKPLVSLRNVNKMEQRILKEDDRV